MCRQGGLKKLPMKFIKQIRTWIHKTTAPATSAEPAKEPIPELPPKIKDELKRSGLTWGALKSELVNNHTLDPVRQASDLSAVDVFTETFSIDEEDLVSESFSDQWEYYRDVFLCDPDSHEDAYRILLSLLVLVRRTLSISSNSRPSSPLSLVETEIQESRFTSDDFTMGEVAPLTEGRSAYRPVNVSNNFHNGFLYYPVEVVEVKNEFDKSAGKVVQREKRTTVVVRSDRTVHTAQPSDLPADAVTGERIYRLTDGTLIQHPPRASDYSSWEWESIQKFVSGNEEVLPLPVLLHSLYRHMHHRIWLPSEADYWVLALAAAASYCQAVFDAVPLILLTGPAGTGKSELSAAMSEVSANAVMVSQGSAPTIMRLVDESGGLVVVDDLEAVGNKKGQERFNEIAQVLKVSYKKESAIRIITDRRTGRTSIMNFFGIKIISNTLGVDRILGSRMLHVHTRAMPSYEKKSFHMREKFPVEARRGLRNNLHTWAFRHASDIRDTYLSMYSNKTNRDDEIAAPLRVLAAMSEDPTIIAHLEHALESQAARRKNKDNPEELLSSSLQHLVLEGYREITPQHLVLEMRRQLDPGHMMEQGVDIPAWARPEWVGRRLRELGYIKDGEGVRKRLHNTQLRVLPVTHNFIKTALAKKPHDQQPEREALSFCASCDVCPYREYECEIAGKRFRKVATA